MHRELQAYVRAWQTEIDDVLRLLDTISGPAWSRPTDLPGWDVQDVVAHLAHLETELAGAGEDSDSPHDPATDNRVRVTPDYTQAGVDARRERSPEDLVDELRHAARSRAERLADDPPAEPTDRVTGTPAGLAWDQRTLLGNRVIDVWMHGQDIRRAVRTPGNLRGDGADHARATFVRSWPALLAKRARIGSGDVVRLHLTDTGETHTWACGSDGRVTSTDDDPTLTLAMSTEDLCLLGGGRRDSATLDVQVTGDRDLAARVLPVLTVTP